MAVWYSFLDLVLSRLDAEAAHGLAIRALKTGLLPGDGRADAASLATTIWGRSLPNPIGLAAGFDKNAEVADAMLAQGFGLVEIGSVTPRSGCRRTAVSSTAWVFPARAWTPPDPALPPARGAASSASMSAPTRTASIAPLIT